MMGTDGRGSDDAGASTPADQDTEQDGDQL